MRNYRLYLTDILDAIESIESFVEGMNLQEFLADEKTKSAVVRQFEIIGEAAKGVPEDIRRKYPDVPWHQMAAMRDVLIHTYFGVDYELVWRTIQERLPEVKVQIEYILKQWGSEATGRTDNL